MASERATRQEGFPVKEYWALDQTFGPVSGHGSAIDRDLTIQEMLKLGANPNVRDKVSGNTAVHIAAKTLISPLVEVLCNNDFQKAKVSFLVSLGDYYYYDYYHHYNKTLLFVEIVVSIHYFC